MKKYIIFYLALAIFTTFSAQNYRIYYKMSYKTDSLDINSQQKKDMLLLFNENNKKFISVEQYKKDSIQTITANTPLISDYEFAIRKDIDNYFIYNKILISLYQTKLPPPKLNWVITNEKKRIFEYDCQKAILNYSGRIWEAWFTDNFPISTGPYVFDGLPGLIIYLKDTKNNYEFLFNGLKNGAPISYINYSPYGTLTVTPKQIKKIKLDHYNNPFKDVKMGSQPIIMKDEKGNIISPDYRELTKSEQDYIRKNNNPIELSEAIKYK